MKVHALTIQELEGSSIQYPGMAPVTFKKAATQSKAKEKQVQLL